MGRYAFFNTDYEYKFRFGFQNSSDILLFGGKYDGEDTISWSQEEQISILDELEHFPYKLPDFEKFEKNLSGTYKLKSFIEENNKNLDNYELLYGGFVLGCLIYHQLLYETNLSAHFEW